MAKRWRGYGLAVRTRYSRYFHGQVRKKYNTNIMTAYDRQAGSGI